MIAVVESPVQTYFVRLARVLEELDWSAVERLVGRIRRTRDAGGTIYTLGNGGSASTASHLAVDLAKNVRRADRPNLRVVALTDSLGLLTAWANDACYEQVFAEQIRGLLRPEDLVIAISGSGNSPNVLAAVRTARDEGASSFGICGFAGGRLALEADDSIVVPSDNMQFVEDAHLAVVHALMTALRDEG